MKRTRTPSRPAHSLARSPKQRIAIVALVLGVLVSLTATIAWFSRSDGHTSDTPPPTARNSAPTAPSSSAPTERAGSVPAPPKVTQPVKYAKAAAVTLWTYDTRHTSRTQHLAGLRAWMTSESRYADWDSVRGQVPDPLLWSRMADQKQHATATASDAHFPAAFNEALADDPAALTKAYVYFVTVTGKQSITWAKNDDGAEERSITLAVQCRPSTPCSLVAIAPRVAP